ncbi:hypothetical protein MTR67_042473 [Solanum verrucosum]|uniref:Uncharacterized protein n=1 Tax=Solanum verrucosum TaxID=315347 RepID=A0AAF0UM03_SOLVR|nr:hypothetical protein MTR67_042473 [Solanum verrucosum]
MASVIEQCQVAPPPSGAAEVTLPLTYFDLVWLGFHRIRRILFYKLPISKPDFVQNIIPPLKNSLSFTLKHYTPLAGNVARPLDTNGYPELRYVTGDFMDGNEADAGRSGFKAMWGGGSTVYGGSYSTSSPFPNPISFKTLFLLLKIHLSLTLKHYTPLAGNVARPLDTNGYPELRYVTGDSISVIFSESDMDFNYLIGDHLRNAKDFYHFVPKLGEPKDAPRVQLAPVLAIQVTLFPNLGVSIGFTNHHVVGDGATIVGFIRAWALLHKFGGDEQFLSNELIPFYDRSVVKDPYGQGMFIWEEMKKKNLDMRDIMTPPPEHKVRGTFTIRRDDIEKLKNLILKSRRQGSSTTLTHVTSFTVTCAYVWTCLIKSKDAIGEEMIIDDSVIMESFGCAGDFRARFNPPLPQSYFGNCIVGCVTRSIRHVDLVGKGGFEIAVELIGEVIQKQMKDEEWVLNGNWLKVIDDIDLNRFLSIAGSPKHDLYAADFGWGKAAKLEFISLDNEDGGISMSLSKSKDFDGDLEIGLSLSKTQMNAFAAIFTHGLSFLYQV